jgi:putative Mn2+ efflux pump MntP
MKKIIITQLHCQQACTQSILVLACVAASVQCACACMGAIVQQSFLYFILTTPVNLI